MYSPSASTSLALCFPFKYGMAQMINVCVWTGQ